MNKEHYQAPAIEVYRMEHEGIMATSFDADLPSNNLPKSQIQNGYNTGIATGLDEMITNILTFEQ